VDLQSDHSATAFASSAPGSTPAFGTISPAQATIAVAAAGLGYSVGFGVPDGAAAVLIALPALCLLGRARTTRQAFYFGILVGLAMYAPPLTFFLRVFGPSAALLWVVLALPTGIFVLLLALSHRQLGPTWTLCLTPFFWTAVEYFRSEVWYLRFAWLLPGQAAAFLPGVRWASLGVYGLGFIYMLIAALVADSDRTFRILGLMGMVVAAVLMYVPSLPPTPTDAKLRVAGVQLEEAKPQAIAAAIDRLAIAHPEAQILVLSEYTFSDPVPPIVRDVVRKHARYLIVGGCRYVAGEKFYDTAFVIGPDGNDLFEQAKSVPVQFMLDGLPAKHRKVWNSPWGKIGIAVCYDLSYARVMDDFVRQGAQGLIIPTMDIQTWGEYERRNLHGRMAPIRSAEYGIPTFGVWSSGVSQLTDRYGRVLATAGYPGQGEMIAGPFDLQQPGHIPPDRWLVNISMAGTVFFVLLLAVLRIRHPVVTPVGTPSRPRL
jgi:apolipoprotein N-acyltransferase